mgnify:CR=1 FL=1
MDRDRPASLWRGLKAWNQEASDWVERHEVEILAAFAVVVFVAVVVGVR